MSGENKRLQDHIHDLETRKRAPLYQKKQEEELRAATEKAQEAEGRAQEAEAKFKEAKVTLQPAGDKMSCLIPAMWHGVIGLPLKMQSCECHASMPQSTDSSCTGIPSSCRVMHAQQG